MRIFLRKICHTKSQYENDGRLVFGNSDSPLILLFVLSLIIICALLNLIGDICLVVKKRSSQSSDSSNINESKNALTQNSLNYMLKMANLNDWCYGLTLLLFVYPVSSSTHASILKMLNISQVLTHALNFFIFLFFHKQFRQTTRDLIRKVNIFSRYSKFFLL